MKPPKKSFTARTSINNWTTSLRKYLPKVAAVAVFGGLGSWLLVGTHAATPTASVEAGNGAVLGNASSVSDSTASGSRAVKFGTSAGATTAYAMPGTVGYLGSQSALTNYAPAGSGLPGAGNAPAGCAWQTGIGLNCTSTTLTFDHVFIHGGVYFQGTGDATITNSIIENNVPSQYYDFWSNHYAGNTVTALDSTFTWDPANPSTAGNDFAGVWGGGREVVRRCDFSGFPQGLDPPGSDDSNNPSIVENNVFHDFVQTGSGARIDHMDGIYSQGASYLTITGNYVSLPTTGATNGVIFFQGGTTDTGITVSNNYFYGGGYTFVNDTALNVVVTNNVFGGGSQFGDVNLAGGSIATWTGNVHSDGSPVAKP